MFVCKHSNLATKAWETTGQQNSITKIYFQKFYLTKMFLKKFANTLRTEKTCKA